MKTAMTAVRLLISFTLLFCHSSLLAWYKAQDIQIKAAKEYIAHQEFQKLIIAAYPCGTEKKTLELFDTKKLHKHYYMPILIVIENHNDFAITLDESEIVLLDPDGGQEHPIPFEDVVVRIDQKKSKVPFPTGDLSRVKDKKLLADFERKAFGEKMIAPHDKDYGVVFYRLPADGDLGGYRLYLPQILNLSNDEPLMFFEFALDGVEP